MKTERRITLLPELIITKNTTEEIVSNIHNIQLKLIWLGLEFVPGVIRIEMWK